MVSERAGRQPGSAVRTPFVVIDPSRVQRNIKRIQAAADACSGALRPHFKTHRLEWLARQQLQAGAFGLTCATAGQLDALTRIASRILVSSPIQVDRACWRTIGACADGVLFSAASDVALRSLRAALGPDLVAQVLLEVDVGCDRGGLDPEECGALARKARRLGLDVVGALAYPGQGYAPGQQAYAAEAERDLLARAGVSLQRAGVAVQHLSAGSTPTMPHVREGPATEFRPGTYVFGDVQQLVLGAVGPSDIALHVVATVLAQRDGQVVLDAGAKVLGRDRPPWVDGHGRLAGGSNVAIAKVYDHHAIVLQERGRPSFAIGDRVHIIPNNVNSVLALRRRVWVDAGSGELDSLEPLHDD